MLCPENVKGRPPQTREGRHPVEKQSFGRYNVHIHLVAFELHVCELINKIEGIKLKLNKIEKRTKLKFYRLLFPTVIKVSRTYKVDFAIE